MTNRMRGLLILLTIGLLTTGCRSASKSTVPYAKLPVIPQSAPVSTSLRRD